MKQTLGIWLPDSDKHFAVQIAGNPLVAGKGTYQWKKYVAALSHVKDRGHAVDVGAHVGLWSRLMAMDFERVTAFEPVDEERARKVKSDGVLVKPFETHEVITRVRELIDGVRTPQEPPVQQPAPPVQDPAPPVQQRPEQAQSHGVGGS